MLPALTKQNSHRAISIPKPDELIKKAPLTRDPAEKKWLALEAAV